MIDPFQSYAEINFDQIISSFFWNHVLTIKEPNIAINELTNIIHSCLEYASCYKQKSRINKDYIPRKKWITKAILVSCKTKENLYNIWKKCPNNITFKNDYKNYEKILNKVIKNAKFKFENSEVKRINQNSRLLWKTINGKLGKNSQHKIAPNYLIVNNQRITDKSQMANTMNGYYCRVGKDLSNQIPNINPEQLKLPDNNEKSIFIHPTNYQEVQKYLNEMKNKAGGVDNINTTTLQLLATHIATPLAYIFNLCIQESIWPDALKKADIVPIYKTGDSGTMSNYRPISLISNLAKLLEKIIYNRLYNFLITCQIISDRQFGFVKNRGTTDALNHISNIIYKNLDKSKPIITAFLDLAKAFDTVDHAILINKLEKYGIRGNTLNLLKSYLTGRKQSVKILNCKSDYEEISIGVPQGTILGPLFFILYVNDLLLDMCKDTIMSYADDTVVISSDDSWTSAQNKMNGYLNLVSKWLTLNKLSLNLSKTVFITFGNYCNSVPDNANILIGNYSIKRVESHKYLGLIFDYNMRWDKHIEGLVKKTKYLIYIFAKIKKIFDRKTLLMIYYAFFQSLVNYGIIAWGGAYCTYSNLVQRIQNKILKIINKNHFLANDQPLTIRQLYQLEAVSYHYTTLKELYVNSTSNSRNKSLQLPKIMKTKSQKNSYYVAIYIFNLLCNDLKILELHKITIKRKLKIFIRENIV